MAACVPMPSLLVLDAGFMSEGKDELTRFCLLACEPSLSPVLPGPGTFVATMLGYKVFVAPQCCLHLVTFLGFRRTCRRSASICWPRLKQFFSCPYAAKEHFFPSAYCRAEGSWWPIRGRIGASAWARFSGLSAWSCGVRCSFLCPC